MFPDYSDYNNSGSLKNLMHNNRLKVFGRGIVSVKPDMAEVIVGIITENAQLEIAQNENDKLTKQVIENIKSMGVASKDIQTQNYSINVTYDFIDGKQTFRGYNVSNYLRVTIRDINTVGDVVDAAVKGGANAINNASFMVSDASGYYNEALKLAIKDAQSKAMAVASKLRVNINMVPKQIVEQGVNNVSPLVASFKIAEEVTSIQPGENRIIANIEGVFIYYDSL